MAIFSETLTTSASIHEIVENEFTSERQIDVRVEDFRQNRLDCELSNACWHGVYGSFRWRLDYVDDDRCVADKFLERTLSSELCAAYAVGMLIFLYIAQRCQHNLAIVLHHSRAKLLSSLTSGKSSTCFRRL